MASTELHAGYPYEKRYPFLDRDLLEFLTPSHEHSWFAQANGAL
jgi:hypothetical protein